MNELKAPNKQAMKHAQAMLSDRSTLPEERARAATIYIANELVRVNKLDPGIVSVVVKALS